MSLNLPPAIELEIRSVMVSLTRQLKPPSFCVNDVPVEWRMSRTEIGMKQSDRDGLGIRRLTFASIDPYLGLYFSFHILSSVSSSNLPTSRIFVVRAESRGLWVEQV